MRRPVRARQCLRIALQAIVLVALPGHLARAAAPRATQLSLVPTLPGYAPRPDEFCLACHGDTIAHLTPRTEDGRSLYVQQAQWDASPHGKAGIGCPVCHSRQAAYPHPEGLPRREVQREFAIRVCGGCHDEQLRAYSTDVHGRVVVDGSALESATCTDCHGAHQLIRTSEPQFRVSLTDACIRCHADERKMATPGLSTSVVASYLQDFHGVSVELLRNSPERAARYAMCTDCHGSHSMQPSEKLAADSDGAGVLSACRKCHPDATAQFAGASAGHGLTDASRRPAARLASRVYDYAIPGAVGSMLLYILLETLRHVLGKLWRPAPARDLRPTAAGSSGQERL